MRAMLPVQRSMDNFILAATQAQVEGVDRIAQVFVQRMNVALGNEFDHLRQVLADTGAEQQKTQQELRAATEAIGQMTQDVVNMHQLSQGVLEHFRAYVADMDASRAQVDDTNRKTIELLEAMGKTSGQQALYLAKLQEYQAALTAASQQYTAWTDRFLASAQEQTRITGKEMEKRLDQVNITVNKNTIPDDPQSPFVTSGIRVGVPAATSRGLREEDMKVIGQLIWKTATEFDTKQEEIRAAVAEITAKYPLYE